jgi:uncharacterized protein (TIGR02421 family)
MGTPSMKISSAFIKVVCDRLVENKRVRRQLTSWGRLHIDRKLPFLCVYRRPRGQEDLGTARLIQGEASYLMGPGHRQAQKGLSLLVQRIAETMAERFGAFLILELWSATEGDASEPVQSGLRRPVFRILAPRDGITESTVEILEGALKKIRLRKLDAEVHTLQTGKTTPPGFPDFLSPRVAKTLGCSVIGLEVKPIYRDTQTGQLYPLVFRRLHKGMTRALKRTFYEFSRSRTSLLPSHFLSLGRRAFVKAVWDVDQKLAQVSDALDILMYVTPTNADSAWTRFKKKDCDSAPKFTYRPLPIEPALLKRRLYNITIERIEDPVMAQLFREKQEELDRKIDMLNNRNSSRFLWGSLQLFGGNDKNTLNIAKKLLRLLPPRSREDSTSGHVNAEVFAKRAIKEISYYREKNPEISASVEIRKDISGLMVSHGNLLIGKSIKVPGSRVEALIQHELGTHLLTYLNGKAQRFKQLYSGLAGYEELQEGLAVLAEYLTGGLSRPRLRLLAARVLAVRLLLDGASFVDTFRELDRSFDFERRTAFMATMRVYRAGGLTKDAIYLKGFLDIIKYLKKDGSLDTLFVGKIGSMHIPIIKELQWRKVISPPLLRPRYLDDPQVQGKLEHLINTDFIEEMVRRKKT